MKIMKWISGCLCILLFACSEKKTETVEIKESTQSIQDKVIHEEPPLIENPKSERHSNARFRNVAVEKINDGQFKIIGEGQIFEANFNWVVEDGHNELKKGFEMTDAGAPEWGKFDFKIDVKKEQENSTLTLILFEISAKDGSRQHELAIALPD